MYYWVFFPERESLNILVGCDHEKNIVFISTKTTGRNNDMGALMVGAGDLGNSLSEPILQPTC